MYEAFKGVNGPDAEAIRSDIFKLLLIVNYLLCLRVILINFIVLPRPPKTVLENHYMIFGL